MARSILEYDDFSKQLILAFKHGDRTDLTPILVKFLTLADKRIFDDVDMVMAVTDDTLYGFGILLCL